MFMSDFMEIGRYKDITLRLPKNIPYSFFNSPYPAHRERGAVDVYFPSEALFPCDHGKVVEIKYFRSPKIRKDSSSIEPLILIDLGDIFLKVLHVEPRVKVGEKLFLGDPLGNIIVSGYLYYWSDPHAHFELRPKNDPYRARGTIPINPTFLQVVKGSLSFEFKVVKVREHYVLAKPIGGEPSLGAIGNTSFCVDGGIPHYGYYGIVGKGSFPIPGKASGSIVLTDDLKIYANNMRIRGIGTLLGTNLVKIIPISTTDEFFKGETLNITFAVNSCLHKP